MTISPHSKGRKQDCEFDLVLKKKKNSNKTKLVRFLNSDTMLNILES